MLIVVIIILVASFALRSKVGLSIVLTLAVLLLAVQAVYGKADGLTAGTCLAAAVVAAMGLIRRLGRSPDPHS